MKPFSRILCIVLDGVGIGEAPDAAAYGDAGSNSVANTARHVGSLRLPFMEQMGLGNLASIDGLAPVRDPIACYGAMQPASAGKDSVSGHWELMGCLLDAPFPVYARGFPEDLVRAFERLIGRRVLGNRAASGTTILQELGESHVKTGCPILYTSQDSVFQLAAHEAVIPVETLYAYCEAARRLLKPPHQVARVIARPFAGQAGGFYRTPRRKDFSVAPPQRTVLDELAASGREVLTVGKIHDLFAGRGITRSIPTANNREGMDVTLREVRGGWSFIFTNLIDFDTMWGHRNDARAYALGLEEFDSYLSGLVSILDDETLLIVTSDHGNDPTTPSTDHSRECVPLLAYCRTLRRGIDLGIRKTFADVGKTIAENFAIDGPQHTRTRRETSADEALSSSERRSFPGTSFLAALARRGSKGET